jgi:DNA-directed RNA polymerase subunit RPC12/RpoP
MAAPLTGCGIRCARCNGQMLLVDAVETYYALECLQCGEHRFVPQRGRTKRATAPVSPQPVGQPVPGRLAVLPAVATPPGDASRIA